MTCTVEYLRLPVNTFREAYYLDKDQSMYFLNSYEKHQAPKLVFSGCSQRLQEVLHGITRRKFIKAILRFQNWTSDKIIFWPDFVENSFYWEEICAGQRVMNGGLIWHGTEYSVHT